MATIAPTKTNVTPDGSSILVTWAASAGGDTFTPFKMGAYSIATVQIYGSAVTSVGLVGSNDADAPTNFNTLRDMDGTAITAVAAAGFKSPIDLPLWIKPSNTTGTSVTFAALLHRADRPEHA